MSADRGILPPAFHRRRRPAAPVRGQRLEAALLAAGLVLALAVTWLLPAQEAGPAARGAEAAAAGFRPPVHVACRRRPACPSSPGG